MLSHIVRYVFLIRYLRVGVDLVLLWAHFDYTKSFYLSFCFINRLAHLNVTELRLCKKISMSELMELLFNAMYAYFHMI